MKKIYSVTELTKLIKHDLEVSFSYVWIEGEVSNFIKHSSGHMYFTVKDAGAQIQAVMFRHVNRSLKFKMENGIKIVVGGKISVYESRGSYQIYAEMIEPKGLGSLQLAFEQLKEKLKKEGLFDAFHKKQLPFLPRVIGVVTSPTGAAIRDILQIVDRRFSNINVILNPVKVQGAGAAQEIANAIVEFNQHEKCDVLIVGRGGGSLEDLWAFNEEVVARAIFDSKIPIISAVGHEIDFTISDFVADLRAPTPSAAAELVVFSKSELLSKVDALDERLYKSVVDLIALARERLISIKDSYAFRQPENILNQFRQRVDEYLRQLHNYGENLVVNKKQIFAGAVAQLEALSPLSVLSRGYSVTVAKQTGKTVVDSEELNVGDIVVTKLANGSIESKVLVV